MTEETKPPEPPEPPAEEVALAPEEKLRVQAQTLFVCGYAPDVIAKRLDLTTTKVTQWIRLGRWDQAREKVKRAVDKKVLAAVRRDASQLANEQIQQLRWMEAKLFNNLRGLDRAGNPILNDAGEPVGELHVDSAYDAMQLWIMVNRLSKDWLMQILPSISEALPQLDPSELRLIRTENPPAQTEAPNQRRAHKRARGKKRTPAADKILGKVLPFTDKETGNG